MMPKSMLGKKPCPVPLSPTKSPTKPTGENILMLLDFVLVMEKFRRVFIGLVVVSLVIIIIMLRILPERAGVEAALMMIWLEATSWLLRLLPREIASLYIA